VLIPTGLAPRLAKHGANQHGERTLFDNVQIKQQGTSAPYLAARLKRYGVESGGSGADHSKVAGKF